MDPSNKSLSLPHRKDIRDNTSKRDENLQKIERVTGVGPWTFVFDGDIAAFNSTISDGYRDRSGEIFYGSYLSCLASCIETCCQDDMAKEALVEKCSKKQVIIRPDESLGSGSPYQRISFADDSIVISFNPSNYWTNIDSDVTYFKLETLL